MSSSHHILVVEGDPRMAREIAETLRLDGFEVTTVTDARALREALRDHAPALVILDADLPEQNGLTLLRQLRAEPRHVSLPILMTSTRSDEIDRVVALELGVDDYQEKPLSLRELCLRVRAILRRRTTPPTATPKERLVLGTLEIDLARHRVVVDARDVVLTPLELRLLAFLVGRADRIVTRDTLLETVWGLPPGSETRTVDTTIKRLRRKLGSHGAMVETVRGVGYRMRPSAREPEPEPEPEGNTNDATDHPAQHRP